MNGCKNEKVRRWSRGELNGKRERSESHAYPTINSFEGHLFRLQNPNRKAHPSAQKPQQCALGALQSWLRFQKRNSDRKRGETRIAAGEPQAQLPFGQFWSRTRYAVLAPLRVCPLTPHTGLRCALLLSLHRRGNEDPPW